MIKSNAIEKRKKDYNQMDWEEMKCSEKDWDLPKLFPLTSQNQARKVNKETGKEIEETKC